MGEAYKQLELNIISAQDLKGTCLFGRLGTYAVVWINFEKKLTTQIDRTGGTNPTWNDKAIFRVEERFLRSETSALTVEIYCEGCLRDTLVGTARVLLSNFLNDYGTKAFRGMTFSSLQVRRPSSRPQGLLNLGTRILDGLDLHWMNIFNPSVEGALGFRYLTGNPVQPRPPSFVDKLWSIRPNHIDTQKLQSRFQNFINICKKGGTDQEKHKGGDEITEKKEKKKAVGCYHILMAPKLKRNGVGLRNRDQECALAYNRRTVVYRA